MFFRLANGFVNLNFVRAVDVSGDGAVLVIRMANDPVPIEVRGDDAARLVETLSDMQFQKLELLCEERLPEPQQRKKK